MILAGSDESEARSSKQPMLHEETPSLCRQDPRMILVIQCSDQVGLVASISGLLSGLKINIVSMREHVDTHRSLFFARLEVQGQADPKEIETRLKLILPKDARVEAKSTSPKKLVVLVTKEHHCLSDLLIRHHFKTADFQIECVIGNHEDLREICEKFKVPFFHVSHEGKTKEQFETELSDQISKFSYDLIVLAKFMRILSSAFVAKVSSAQGSGMKIVNIHHSFLPAFIGSNPYRQAYERGVKLIGATAHFVTDALDEGPILTQQIIPVDHTFGVAEMIRAGKEIEVAVLAKALRLVCEDRSFVDGNKTVIFE